MSDNIVLIDPNETSGSNCLILGGSSTGKTSLLVSALRNLDRLSPHHYDVRLLFTGSINAKPFVHLPKDIIIFKAFLPKLIKKLVSIQQLTSNRYNILLIFDDIPDLRGKIAEKIFTIYRNSNISCIALIQHYSYVTPAMRDSCHNLYITGARNTGAREKLINLFIKPYLIDRGFRTKTAHDNYVRDATFMGDSSRNLIHIDTTADEMNVISLRK